MKSFACVVHQKAKTGAQRWTPNWAAQAEGKLIRCAGARPAHNTSWIADSYASNNRSIKYIQNIAGATKMFLHNYQLLVPDWLMLIGGWMWLITDSYIGQKMVASCIPNLLDAAPWAWVQPDRFCASKNWRHGLWLYASPLNGEGPPQAHWMFTT